MKSFRFDSSRNISSGIALLVILTLSVFVAYLSLSTARKIVDAAPESKAFNFNKRDYGK
ncbi:MAG: hypothetical protein Q7S18_00765 [bacterium]|nr:hypothetical protein [bacterium]